MFLPCKFAILEMQKCNGGGILNIGSISGTRSMGMSSIGYNTAKAALAAVTRGPG